MKTVPFCDLGRQYKAIRKEVDSAINRTMSSGRYILGREVEGFEREFANYCGVSFGIGVSSGTEALHIALLACGVGPGDEVITVANAGVPMVVAITSAGATPVFADIDPVSYNIDASKIIKRITRKTKAILPVHLYGQCADMAPILKIARQYSLKVIEDACQAHGAVYGGKKAGSIGDVGCYSFYPTKNLGCYGDGGMIVVKDKALNDRVRMLRDYGQKERYRHELKGFNSRLDEIQASILRAKLKFLDGWNERRSEIARIYNDRIENESVIKPYEAGRGSHVYHLHVVSCAKREGLRKYLTASGIQTIVHYPVPVYRQKAYVEFKAGNICRYADACSGRVLSLPLYPEMRYDEIEYVCKKVNDFHI